MQKLELKKGIALSRPKGFTLIELLIVIGILAVLATVTLLVLNPAQMFAQARDSQRISDLNTLKSGISLYLSLAPSPSLDNNNDSNNLCSTDFWGTFATTSNSTLFTNHTNSHISTSTSVDGSGWLPIPLSSMPGGSPISALPLDPVGAQTVSQAYYYLCSTTNTFKLVGNLESDMYKNTGSNDKESTDGGIFPDLYETGTDLKIN
jgi:prepilin-type N-terminal cleavage/methylation domain-containing protein